MAAEPTYSYTLADNDLLSAINNALYPDISKLTPAQQEARDKFDTSVSENLGKALTFDEKLKYVKDSLYKPYSDPAKANHDTVLDAVGAWLKGSSPDLLGSDGKPLSLANYKNAFENATVLGDIKAARNTAAMAAAKATVPSGSNNTTTQSKLQTLADEFSNGSKTNPFNPEAFSTAYSVAQDAATILGGNPTLESLKSKFGGLLDVDKKPLFTDEELYDVVTGKTPPAAFTSKVSNYANKALDTSGADYSGGVGSLARQRMYKTLLTSPGTLTEAYNTHVSKVTPAVSSGGITDNSTNTGVNQNTGASGTSTNTGVNKNTGASGTKVPFTYNGTSVAGKTAAEKKAAAQAQLDAYDPKKGAWNAPVYDAVTKKLSTDTSAPYGSILNSMLSNYPGDFYSAGYKNTLAEKQPETPKLVNAAKTFADNPTAKDLLALANTAGQPYDSKVKTSLSPALSQMYQPSTTNALGQPAKPGAPDTTNTQLPVISPDGTSIINADGTKTPIGSAKVATDAGAGAGKVATDTGTAVDKTPIKTPADTATEATLQKQKEAAKYYTAPTGVQALYMNNIQNQWKSPQDRDNWIQANYKTDSYAKAMVDAGVYTPSSSTAAYVPQVVAPTAQTIEAQRTAEIQKSWDGIAGRNNWIANNALTDPYAKELIAQGVYTPTAAQKTATQTAYTNRGATAAEANRVAEIQKSWTSPTSANEWFAANPNDAYTKQNIASGAYKPNAGITANTGNFTSTDNMNTTATGTNGQAGITSVLPSVSEAQRVAEIEKNWGSVADKAAWFAKNATTDPYAIREIAAGRVVPTNTDKTVSNVYGADPNQMTLTQGTDVVNQNLVPTNTDKTVSNVYGADPNQMTLTQGTDVVNQNLVPTNTGIVTPDVTKFATTDNLNTTSGVGVNTLLGGNTQTQQTKPAAPVTTPWWAPYYSSQQEAMDVGGYDASAFQ